MLRANRDRLKVALGLVAASSLLAACSAGGSSGGDELHVLVGALPDKAAAQKTWFKQMEKDFKAKTGATLVFETYADAQEEQQKLQTSMVSGTGPDVYTLGTTFTPVAYATGGFLTLSAQDWQKIGGRDQFAQEALAMSGPDAQHQIGVPTGMRPFGLVYNTKMFKAAGIKAPPRTWDELLADAEKLTSPSDGVYGLALDYADDYSPWKYVWNLTEENGGSFVSGDLRKSQLDSQQVVDAVSSYFDLVTKHKVVSPASTGWENAQAVAAFGSGKAAMLPMTTTTIIPTLQSSAVKGDYAFAPMPSVPFGMSQRPPDGVAAGTIVSGDNAGIAKYTDSKDLALEYLRMVTSKQRQLQYAEMIGDIPANQEAADIYARRTPLARPFVQAGRTAVPTAFTGAWADVQIGLGNVMTQSLPDLAHGHYDPAKVKALLGKADSDVQSSLDRAQ